MSLGYLIIATTKTDQQQSNNTTPTVSPLQNEKTTNTGRTTQMKVLLAQTVAFLKQQQTNVSSSPKQTTSLSNAKITQSGVTNVVSPTQPEKTTNPGLLRIQAALEPKLQEQSNVAPKPSPIASNSDCVVCLSAPADTAFIHQ